MTDMTDMTENQAQAPLSLAFTIPFVPVAKGRPRFARFGKKGEGGEGGAPGGVRTYTPKKTSDFEGHVATAMAAALDRAGHAGAKISGPVRLDLILAVPRTKDLARVYKKTGKPVYPPGLLWHTKRPDRDNCEKAVMDGLNAFLSDDAVVCAGETLKVYAPLGKAGFVSVWLVTMDSTGPTWPEGFEMPSYPEGGEP
jgi:Holliday junction resolvase RusA-like endonuclease